MSDVVDAIVVDLKTIRDRGELDAYLGSAGRRWPALTAVPARRYELQGLSHVMIGGRKFLLVRHAPRIEEPAR